MRLDFDIRLTDEQQQYQLWKRRPFAQADGIEILENARIAKRKSVNNTPQKEDGDRRTSLQGKYIDVRNHVLGLSHPESGTSLVRNREKPLDKPTYLTVVSETNSGKSSTLMGFRRLFLQDEYLRAELGQEGVELDVETVPFAMVAEAAKTRQVQLDLPQFAVPADVRHGGYAPETYDRIARFQKYIIDTHISSRRGEGRATLGLIEFSSPSVFPSDRHIPIGVSGGQTISSGGGLGYEVEPSSSPLTLEEMEEARAFGNRGASSVYELAVDEQTKDDVFFFGARKRDENDAAGKAWRSLIFNEAHLTDEDIEELYRGDMRVIVSHFNRQINQEEEVDVSMLAPEHQRIVTRFLQLAMAPVGGIVRSDNEVEEVMRELSFMHILPESPSRRDYFNVLMELLTVDKSKHTYYASPFTDQQKTYDLDFYLKSLPMKLYGEEILSKIE